MEYKVLYRKYRPLFFDEIVGQDYIVNILKKSVANSKLSHAYLFSGPRGTGKTTAAKVFAKAVNCLNNEDGNACGKCKSCLAIDDSPDIIEIDAASNNGVDEIRELRDNVKLVPSNLKYKVYIIDEVHMLSTSAFNALLKTLEEPPKHVIFILATTDVQKIPATVISRCQKFDFKKVSNIDIAFRLRHVASLENIKIDDETIEEISFMSDGALRDALGLLDQISTIFDNEVTIEKFTKEYKSVSSKQLDELVKSLENNDHTTIIRIVKEMETLGIDHTTFVNKFTNLLRQKAELVKQTPNICKLTFYKIKDIIFSLNNLLLVAKTSINPYLLIEIELLSHISPDNLIKEISMEETVVKSGIEVIKNKETLETPEKVATKKLARDSNYSIRVNNCLAEASKEQKSVLEKKWIDFCNYQATEDIKKYGLLVETHVVAASKTHAIIVTKTPSQALLFNKANKKISANYQKFGDCKYTFVALEEKEWENIKNKYITDKANNIKYSLKEEKKLKIKKSNKIENMAKNIFDETSIEVM